MQIEVVTPPKDLLQEVYVPDCNATDNRGLLDCWQAEREGRLRANANIRATRQWCEGVEAQELEQ